MAESVDEDIFPSSPVTGVVPLVLTVKSLSADILNIPLSGIRSLGILTYTASVALFHSLSIWNPP